jgi:predicted ATPase
MYIDSIALKKFRTFRECQIDFLHPNQDFSQLGLPTSRLPNVNLLLGDNGFGKTTLLKAVALAALGPAVSDAGIYAYRLVRREPRSGTRARKVPGDSANREAEAVIKAHFTLHAQDHAGTHKHINSQVLITRVEDIERLRWSDTDEERWKPIYSSSSDAFFFVGYGATRRVERKERLDPAARQSSIFARAQRVQSLFEDAYSLIPMSAWLPQFKHSNPGRYQQVVHLVNRLMGRGHYTFTGEMEGEEFVFERRGLPVPFSALSDGYRAFLGWVGDLLYHVCMTCPSGKKLVDNYGIVMVDEIDLHLHPRWQMTVLPTLARALPNLQFIVTSHSPLIVGSLEWMNIILMAPAPRQASTLKRIDWAIHGMDADQILLTDFFGLESTRAEGKNRTLKALTLRAREGDADAAMQLLEEMSRGVEELA